MENYDNTVICDYITLWIKDADNNPKSDLQRGVAVWDIPPPAYYYKDRGSVCMMSIVDATLGGGADNIIIMTQNGFNTSTAQLEDGSNQFTRYTQDLGVLGCFINNYAFTDTTFETKYLSPEVIKVLTPARPRTIKLYFVDGKKAIHAMNLESDNGCITVKFEYVRPKLLQEKIYSVENKPAF
tara:strand:+ start:221 stop:769 length:549 start_codon:yes stop_codon:yes gene_type:complete